MSTEINITVEGGNLSDVAWSNQWQNRQNEEQRRQQEKEAKRKAAEEAEQKKLEEQKKAAGTGTSNKYRPDEPAANRLSSGDLGVGWYSEEFSGTYELPSIGRTVNNLGEFVTNYNVTPYRTAAATRVFKGFAGSGTPELTITSQSEPPNMIPAVTPFQGTNIYWWRRFDGTSGFVSSLAPGTIDLSRTLYGARVGYLTGSASRQGNREWQFIVLPAGGKSWVAILFIRTIAFDVDVTAYRRDPLLIGNYTYERFLEIEAELNARDNIFVNGYGLPLDTPDEFSYTVLNDVRQADTYAWCGNRSSVRKIDAPSYFASMNPAVETIPFSMFSGQAVIPRPVNGAPAFRTLYQLGLVNNPCIGPEAFGLLNGFRQFIDPSQIKPFNYIGNTSTNGTAVYSQYVSRDYSQGVFSEGTPLEWFNKGGSFYYRRKKKGASQFTSFKLPLSLSEAREKQAAKTGLDFVFHDVHDGGDPAYCRQMLVAMGFAESDLTP
jgi:hypothetical protein